MSDKEIELSEKIFSVDRFKVVHDLEKKFSCN